MAKIARTGFTEVYRPKDCAPVIDIILIHGLAGHPHRTWACAASQDQYGTKAGDDDGRGRGIRRQFRHVARKLMRQEGSQNDARLSSSTSKSKEGQTDAKDYQFAQELGEQGKQKSFQGYKDKNTSKPEKKEQVFWPTDLLPEVCPKARISVYGYDTIVAGYSRVNKDHLYTLGKNFLYQLPLHREDDLPIIFIAHSLGGLVVKEALIMSIDSQDEDTHSIIASTFAVVFMGTPHRGSKEWASTGDKARKLAQALFMSNNPSLLDSLGLKNGELFRSADRFTQLWHDLDFIVKTYQEGKPLIGVGLGHLGDKVVPDESSLLLNLKEQAESLTADHHGICKFSGIDDENWRKVGPRLKYYYGKVVARREISQSASDDQQAVQELLACVNSVTFNDAEFDIDIPHPGTCEWIFSLPTFQSWLSDNKQPVLCINGKLGSGKSTLLRHIVMTLQQENVRHRNIVAFFVSHSKEGGTRHKPTDVFRSLLVQLLATRSFNKDLADLARANDLPFSTFLSDQDQSKHSRKQKEALVGLFRECRTDQTLIFIDAIDECTDPWELVQFILGMSRVARAADLKICVTSQSVSSAMNRVCRQITVEDFNLNDIKVYIRDKLNLGNTIDQEEESRLRDCIYRESCGVFVWVIIVVDHLQRHLDEGRDLFFLHTVLENVPKELDLLYRHLVERFIASNDSAEVRQAVRVLQWALFSARSLALNEWHHVLAFIHNPELRSIEEWEHSATYTQSNDLLIRRISRLGCGFLDVKDQLLPSKVGSIPSDTNSLGAGAGSFELQQNIRVIHSSVRTFLVKENGFALLDRSIQKSEGEGHNYLLQVCIKYSFLDEMKQAFHIRPRTLRGRNRSRATERSQRSRSHYRHSSSNPMDDPQEYINSRSMSLGSSASSSLHSFHSDDLLMEESEMQRRQMNLSRLKFLEWQKETHSKAQRVAQWLEIQGTTEEGAVTQLLSPTIPNLSLSTLGHVQVIDPPCLWQYSQDMLVHHATVADAAAVNPHETLGFLLAQYWKPWAAVRADMNHNATLEYFAAQWNLVTWLRYLDRTNAPESDWPGGHFEYPIFAAVRLGRKDAFRYLFVRNPLCLNTTDSRGRTVLHYSSATNDSFFLDLIHRISFKVDCFGPPSKWLTEIVNTKEVEGRTALHLAALYASDHGIKRLLSFGANVHEADNSGGSPLGLAISRQVPDSSVVQTLVTAGWDQLRVHFDSLPPFTEAIANGAKGLLELLDSCRREATYQS